MLFANGASEAVMEPDNFLTKEDVYVTKRRAQHLWQKQQRFNN